MESAATPMIGQGNAGQEWWFSFPEVSGIAEDESYSQLQFELDKIALNKTLLMSASDALVNEDIDLAFAKLTSK